MSGNPEISPLRGGCDGALSGRSVMVKGAAGGAAQITSASRITISSTGAAAASGAGGGAYDEKPGTIFCLGGQLCYSGSGGGSGGALLMEAPVVTLAAGAALTANGGGGGCGTSTSGEDAGQGVERALGGLCGDVVKGGDGGAGPDQDGLGGVGLLFENINNVAGGGGGGVGRIRINLPAGETFAPEGVVSPANTAGVLGVR